MKKKFVLALLLSLSLTATAATFPVCAQEELTTESADSQESKDGKTTGMIQNIDTEKSQISIRVMNMGRGGKNGFMMGQPGENGEEPPAMPESNGEQPPAMPEDNGERPDGVSGATKKHAEGEDVDGTSGATKEHAEGEDVDGTSGATKEQSGEDAVTYNVTDKTVITNESGETISLSNLAEKAFVEFTVDGEDLLTVTVSSNANKPGGMGEPGGKPEGMEKPDGMGKPDGTHGENTGTDSQTI